MSDQPPPPKPKPGSLRDRIAAFEKPSSTTGPGPGPAPRPKPGGLSWKPKAPSPPSSAGSSVDHGIIPERKAGGMSASDAKESIGKGGSLKERMAALQGRGGFGAPPPVAAKPMLEKPKWKPPPVISPPLEDKDEDQTDARESTEHIPHTAKSPESDSIKSTGEDESAPAVEGDEPAEVDQEEEERQRRAAIAARMARLGGARVGMAPPVFGKKPSVKKVETPKEEAEETKSLEHVTPDSVVDNAPVKSPLTSEPASTKLDTEPAPDYSITRKKSESSSLHSMDSGSQAARTPGSMPVPAAPRRVAPPRKKVPKAPEAEPTPTASEEAKEIPHATPVLDAEASAAPDVPDVGPEDDQEKLANDIEEETSESTKGEIEPTAAQAPVKILADEPMVEGSFTTLESPHVEGIHEKTLTEDSEGITPAKDDELSLLRTPSVDLDDVPVNVKLEEEEPVPTDDHSLERKASDDINPPPQPQEAAEHPLENLSEEPEEEDEASRRKRVAEKLAKMGGINPFAPAPPQRRPSTSSEDPLSVSPTVQGRAGLKKNSVGSLVSPISPEGKTLRKLSIESIIVAADISSPRRIPDSTVDEAVIEASVSAPHVQQFTRNDTIESTEFGSNVSDPASKRKSQDENISGKGPGSPEAAGALNYNLKIREPRDEILEKIPELGSEREGTDDLELQTHSVHSGALEEARDSDYDHDGEDKHDRDELPAPPSSMPNINTQPKAVSEVVEAASVEAFITSHPRSHVTQAPEDIEPLSPAVPPPPPPPRIVPQILDADEETDKPEPVRAVAPRRLPPPPRPLPQSSEEHNTGAQPLRRLPPTTALDDVREDDEMMAYRNASRPSILSPPMHLPQSRQDGHGHVKEPGIESTTSHRPSRSIPPPPPPALIAEEATEPKQVGVLSHPPKRLLPTPGSPMEGTPLAAPPPENPIRKGTNEHISVSSIPPPPARRSLLPIQPPTQRTVLSPVSPEQLSPPLLSVSDQEILDEEEGDPIDPAFHVPSRQPSPVNLREAQEPSAETVEDTDQTRRRTIAERMARLGGISFGAVPLLPVPRGEDGTSDHPGTPTQEEETSEKTDLTEEEEERARKQRIAAKLAGMGGMRFGMLPPSVGGLLPQQSRTLRDNSGELPHTVSSPPPPPQRTAPPPRPPLPPQPQETDSEHESQTTSDDGVKVEAEESELEEVNYEDAEEPEEAPPPVPTRAGRRTSVPQVEPPLRKTSSTQGGRPPVPSTIPTRRASVQMASPTSRKSSGDSGFSHPRVSSAQTRIPQSEYVMVEDPKTYESDDTALPARPTSRVPPPRGVPPPPAVDSADSIAAQWELPSIPSASLEFGAEGDLSLSTWSEEDSTTYPKPSSSAPPPPPGKHTAQRSSQLPPSRQPSTSNEPKLSSDELMAVWGRVGVQICEVATSLFEKSKKSLVGDGTYHGFVHAALSDVPNAVFPSPPSYGYVVYSQAGSSVQKRVSEIMPGDIVALYDARFKGHKGIQTYHQTVGAGEPLVGIVSEFEPKKSKIRVFQANQHVGQQTVESVSYRLEDLKSGTIEISRVMEA